MTRTLGFLALLTSSCWAQQTAENVSELATISVNVSTTFGERVGPVVAILKAIGPKATYKQYGATINFERIPFGMYALEIQAAGFNIRREQVAVYQAEVQLWVGLVVSPRHSAERSEVVGSVALHDTSPADLWVRLVPLYSSDFVEGRTTSSGTFHLGGVEPGRYLLLVFNESNLLMTRVVNYPGGRLTLDLDLAEQDQREISPPHH